MRKRILIVVTGAILCAGGFAVAQNPQSKIRLKGDTTMDPTLARLLGVIVAKDGKVNQASGQIALFNVSFQVNGVLVRADRAVVNQSEVTLEGNVRMTLPPPK